MGNPVQPLGTLVPPLGNQVLPMGKPVSSLGNPVPAPVAERRPLWGRQVHQGGGDGTPGEEMHSDPGSPTTAQPHAAPWHRAPITQ